MRLSILLLAIFAVLPALAQDQPASPKKIPARLELRNKTCPVTGKPVAKDVKLDWNGVRVRFSSADCIAKFKKEPAKYAAKLGLKLVRTGEGKTVVDLANATCPVRGGKAKEQVFSDLGPWRMHYCCPGCDAKSRKDLSKTFSTLGYHYVPAVVDLRNAKCPMSGEENPTGADAVTADFDGVRVHFCCKRCIKRFAADPAKGFKDLGVDPARIKAETK